jgi:hypothetical protein
MIESVHWVHWEGPSKKGQGQICTETDALQLRNEARQRCLKWLYNVQREAGLAR